jgi:hypothetical protein
MTVFTSPGTNVPSRISFNSGFLDFGTNRIVNIDNISLNVEWSIADLFVINSIKPADKARHSQKVSLSAKIKSFSPELTQFAFGSSVAGTPLESDTLDGQPTLQNPVLTVYDQNSKEIQYQLSNALFKSYKVATKAEDYSEWDIEIEARDIVALNTI